MNKVLLPTVNGYVPTTNGYVLMLEFILSPGTSYDMQFSPDGGNTWGTYGTVTIPAGTFPALAKWSTQLAVPGGWPVRLVAK